MAGTGNEATLVQGTLRSCPLFSDGLFRFDGDDLVIPDAARLAAAAPR